MNVLLPTVYDELFHRLAVGIDPLDAVRRARVPVPIEVVRDPGPLSLERLESLRDRRKTVYDVLAPVTRHASRVHLVLWTKKEKGTIDVRLRDPRERYVPRRLRIPIAAMPTTHPEDTLDRVAIGNRTRRPVLHPGAAYPVGAVTGFRGRLVYLHSPDPARKLPVRWARIEARRGGAVVGFAHSDHKGDFVLLLAPAAIQDAQLPRPLRIELRVFSLSDPPAPPVPDWLERVDPHWDLPLETVGAPGTDPDPVADGTSSPAGWALRLTRDVELTYGSFATSGTAPFEVS